MKRTFLACVLLFTLARSVQLWGQSADWSKVQQLAPNTYISVATRHRMYCDLEFVTSDEIACRSIYADRELRFRRTDVREVRLERGRHNDRWGTAVGAGTGVAVGIARGNPVDAAVFGLGFSVPGYIIGMGSRFFTHGPVIYRRQK